jgi:hypothetical protein
VLILSRLSFNVLRRDFLAVDVLFLILIFRTYLTLNLLYCLSPNSNVKLVRKDYFILIRRVRLYGKQLVLPI